MPIPTHPGRSSCGLRLGGVQIEEIQPFNIRDEASAFAAVKVELGHP